MPQRAPFGTWASPVTLDMATGQMLEFRELRGRRDQLFWLESRPAESGRTTLMQRLFDNTITEITPAPFDVGNKVHEYGGGAYLLGRDKIIFSNKTDGALWLIDGDAPPRVLTRVADCRYADFSFGPNENFIFAIREDHRPQAKNAKGESKAAIVAIDLAPDIDPTVNDGKIIVQGTDFYASPRLSPDGRKLAWITWSHPDMPWDSTKLMLAPIDCVSFAGIIIGAARKLAGTMREAIVQPDWSSAGVLHFCTDRTGFWNVYRYVEDTARLYSVRADIGGPHWVFGQRFYEFQSEYVVLAVSIDTGVPGAVRLRQGAINQLSLGPIGQAPIPLANDVTAYLSTPADAPPSIVVQSAIGGRVVVRSAGDPGLTAKNISVGRPIMFPAAGGQTGYGVLYEPLNSNHIGMESELPPLVVICHGGPTAMAGTAFSMKVQWWTTRGFAVLDVNYSGSSGFGRGYRESLQGKWGVVDVADCLAAATYMGDAAYADKRRMVIRGSSAGGFTVLNALAASDLFRAGASLYGVTDLRQLAQETHKFEAHYLDWLIGPLPQAETLYRNRSPVALAGRIRSPAIFFQGLDDKVVPPAQARSMAEKLRAQGLDAKLHEFSGEGHGFRRAETQRDVLKLETEFYGRVLGFTPKI